MPGRTVLRNGWIHAVLLLCISLAWSCGAARSDDTPGQERVGLMSDHSYFKTRDKPPRISASGNQIAMAQFEGKFLWLLVSHRLCGCEFGVYRASHSTRARVGLSALEKHAADLPHPLASHSITPRCWG